MKNDKKQIAKIAIFITSIFVIFISISYAFINVTLTGSKRQVIKAGTLSLELYEDNAITIADALPMYDEAGMLQDAFTFRLINNSALSANYVIKLVEVGTGTLSTSDVKYGLTKEGETTIGLLSSLTDGIVDSGTIAGNKTTYNYALRFWIKDSVEDESIISGKSLTYRIDVEVSMEEVSSGINIAEVLVANAQTPTETMFNYTSEGCYYDFDNYEDVCVEGYEATNGIYAMEDDDGISYFYRGDVDNLVQFGEYEQDYYVYQYTDNDGIYDYTSLEACQYAHGTTKCTESNKTLKYSAGTPMYWKIIRVNGDGTIRMIYTGTTKDAILQETGIGLSRYNEEVGAPKYIGYTYDRTTTEVNSDAKTEIDNWYNTYLANTKYDDYIVEGKFCSDSSGYSTEAVYDKLPEYDMYTFNSITRNQPSRFGLTTNVTPTFKCAATFETYGGSYTLKAGLITMDEATAAGGNHASNKFYYLYNGNEDVDGYYLVWSMSPSTVETGGAAYVAVVGDYGDVGDGNGSDGLLRPVINLRANVLFQEGTDGTTTTPYKIVE